MPNKARNQCFKPGCNSRACYYRIHNDEYDEIACNKHCRDLEVHADGTITGNRNHLMSSVKVTRAPKPKKINNYELYDLKGYPMSRTEYNKRVRLQTICDEWNKANPVGTPVKYQSIKEPGEPWKYDKTRGLAWVLGDHSPVVALEKASTYCLTHIQPLTDEQWTKIEKERQREGVEL